MEDDGMEDVVRESLRLPPDAPAVQAAARYSLGRPWSKEIMIPVMAAFVAGATWQVHQMGRDDA